MHKNKKGKGLLILWAIMAGTLLKSLFKVWKTSVFGDKFSTIPQQALLKTFVKPLFEKKRKSAYCTNRPKATEI